MQQRRKKFPLILVLIAVVGGGFTFLVMKDIPAPQAAVEKPLDTKKFIKE